MFFGSLSCGAGSGEIAEDDAPRKHSVIKVLQSELRRNSQQFGYAADAAGGTVDPAVRGGRSLGGERRSGGGERTQMSEEWCRPP